jgi:hypothetical protein
MKSLLGVGNESEEQHGLRLVNNLVHNLAVMSFAGDLDAMVAQLDYTISHGLSSRDVESGLDRALMAIRDYVVAERSDPSCNEEED